MFIVWPNIVLSFWRETARRNNLITDTECIQATHWHDQSAFFMQIYMKWDYWPEGGEARKYSEFYKPVHAVNWQFLARASCVIRLAKRQKLRRFRQKLPFHTIILWQWQVSGCRAMRSWASDSILLEATFNIQYDQNIFEPESGNISSPKRPFYKSSLYY